jgi:hypothetical protein
VEEVKVAVFEMAVLLGVAHSTVAVNVNCAELPLLRALEVQTI